MTMKERLRSRVAELTSIIGVSGHEWDVAKYIFDAIKDDVDTIEQLPNGIIVATKKGAHPGPRVMVSAHMDEVGMIVTHVNSDSTYCLEATCTSIRSAAPPSPACPAAACWSRVKRA